MSFAARAFEREHFSDEPTITQFLMIQNSKLRIQGIRIEDHKVLESKPNEGYIKR